MATKKLVGNKERITAVKSVQEKPAANKRPAGIVLKKPSTSSAQKKPASGGSMAGCYRTIATAHWSGNYLTKHNPTMFMEVGDTAAWLLGELSYGYTCIGGTGSIKKMPRGGLEICQPGNTSTGCIEAETPGGQSYNGFISAKVISIAHGTSFQAQETDPELESDEAVLSDEEAAPHCTVVTQNGDVICEFDVISFGRMAREPEVFVHLMRPMLSSNVAIIKTQGLDDMWKSSILRTQTVGTSVNPWRLSDTTHKMRQALDAL